MCTYQVDTTAVSVVLILPTKQSGICSQILASIFNLTRRVTKLITSQLKVVRIIALHVGKQTMAFLMQPDICLNVVTGISKH